MGSENRMNRLCVLGALLCLGAGLAAAQQPQASPTKVYVPYEKLRAVFEAEDQGVFLPYKEFQRLWEAARGAPAEVRAAPVPYLISTARLTGKVGQQIAYLELELTVDILVDGWVEVPIGLGDVAVSKAAFDGDADVKPQPLLRVVKGEYRLVVKGKGRWVLRLDFADQLASKPGLKTLGFRTPSAAITTLDLLIPEENVKVDVEPMLAATTTQVELEGKKATKLQAFLGPAKEVKLAWKPKTETAADLEPVVISSQLQHIHVAEALISHDVTFTFDIRRRGVQSFTIQLPGSFRVISVEGPDISTWDIKAQPAVGAEGAVQTLQVKLFSPAQGSYALTVKMERFLTEREVEIPLTPILTRQVLRRTGLIAITRSPRRTVELRGLKNLARVDTGRLPQHLAERPGVMAYRFIAADYGGALALTAVDPRVTINQLWALGVDADRLNLHGRLQYQVERAGVFQLSMELPEPWRIISIGPANVVDDHQLTGRGKGRKLAILLKRELTGSFHVDLIARADRPAEDADVDFDLPLPDAEYLQLYSGQLMLSLAEQFRAEVAGLDQLQTLPMGKAQNWTSFPGLGRVMAFQFRGIDRANPAGAKFRIAVKPTQVAAVVHRLVNIQPGSVQQEAVIQYRILYAPVEAVYLKMPAELADAGVQISGRDIKEKPRIDQLPPEQAPAPAPPGAEAATKPAVKWAYYKVALQSPVIGSYQLHVNFRRSFQAGQGDQAATVVVKPVLAAGKLSDQSGYVAVAKADTLAIGEPVTSNLIPADPSSAADLPYGPHRRAAVLAFKYTAPPFALSLPVVGQVEAAVFTTIAAGAVVEQVLGRDGTLNARVAYLIATSRGDRLPITLPAGAKLFAVLLNGSEAAVEVGSSPDQRILRLPPSAGQVSRFVLEISYGLEKASASKLAIPALPEDMPVQQTLWRLWVPSDAHVLGFDRDFARVGTRSAEYLLSTLAEGYPKPVQFKLPPQGVQWNFIRQGAATKLSVTLADKEIFGIGLGVVILVAGVAMLKLGGYQRCLVVLGAAVVTFIVRLFAPLFVREAVLAGFWAGGVVLLLWLAQWLFRKRRGRSAPQPAPERPKAADEGQRPPNENQGVGSPAQGEED